MKNKIIFLMSIGILLIANSCEKETNKENLNAVFSYSVNGFVVTFLNFTDFTNYSTPYATYQWDFDDGDTSSENSPTHIYSETGDFVVTLTATKGKQASTFSDTVTVDGPNIIIDGDFFDWEHVGYTYTTDNGGTLLAIKVFSKGKYIYFYMEGTAEMNLSNSPDHIFFNADNDGATGLDFELYPAGSGADYLYEGNLYDWGSISKHTGGTADWSWNTTSPFGVGAMFSDVVDLPDGNKAIEFSIEKAALGNVEGSFSFAFVDLNSGWSPVGSIPAGNTGSSKFLKVDL